MSGRPRLDKGGGGKSVPSPRIRLNLRNHCLLCLLPHPPSILAIVQNNPKKLDSFQPVLHYLTGTDPSPGRSREEREGEGVLVMETLPPTCPPCYDIAAELYDLHDQLLSVQKEIQKQVGRGREVVVKANSFGGGGGQPSNRQRFMERIERSGVSKQEVGLVRGLVEKLHDKFIAEVDTKGEVFFPGGSKQLTSVQPLSLKTKLLQTESSDASKELSEAQLVRCPTSSVIVIGKRKKVCEEEEVPKPEPDIKVEEVEVREIEAELDFSDLLAEADDDVGSPNAVEIESEHEPEPEQVSTPPLPPSPKSPRRRRKLTKIRISDIDQSQSEGEEESAPPVKKQKPGTYKKKPRKLGILPVRVDGVIVSQNCDLCMARVLLTDIESHLEGHGVKDYMTKCLNPECPYVFSCRRKMEANHLTRATDQKSKPKINKCREASNFPKGGSLKKCEECGLIFSDAVDGSRVGGALQTHLQMHEYAMPEKSFVCPIPGCLERYALRQSMEDHIYFHDLRPKKTEQECSLCKALMKVEGMANHLQEEHQVEEVILCKRCPFQFPSRESLLDHYSEHRFRGGIPCDLCPEGLKFRQLERLRQHYFNVHKVGKHFICEHCEKTFFAPTTLSTHVRMKHSEGETEKPKRTYESKVTKCGVDLCPFTCASTQVDTMRTHKIQVHGAEPLKCRYCLEQFTSAAKWRQHEKGHTGLVRNNNWKCPEEGCGKEFRAKRLWIHHKLNGHSGTKPFICDHCGKGFSFDKSLQAHVEKVHLCLPIQRNHVCETCGEGLSSGQALKRHNMIHTGARPFSCHLCGQTFRQKEVLRRHLEGHAKKGSEFKPTGPMKQIRKRVERTD